MRPRAKKPAGGFPTTEALALTNQAADDSVNALVLAREAAASAAKSDANATKAAAIAVAQLERAKPAPADPRDDVNWQRFAGAAQSAWSRMSPMRSRWPELRKFDERLAEIDQQQQRTSETLAALQERRRLAPQAHEKALGDWLFAGQKGARPEAETVALTEQIEAGQAEHTAFDRLRERVLAERIGYVEKFRKRLVAEANKATDQARDDYLATIAQLEVAREELVARRQTSVWAALYPSETLVEKPDTHHLCGGLRKPVEAAIPGLKLVLPAPAVLELLRSDATHLTSIATTAQAAAAQSVTEQALIGRTAMWEGSTEDNERIEREKREAVERYRQQWGRNPPGA